MSENRIDRGTRRVVQMRAWKEHHPYEGWKTVTSTTTRKVDSGFDVCVRVSPECERSQALQQLFEVFLRLADHWDELIEPVRQQWQEDAEKLAAASPSRSRFIPEHRRLILETDGREMWFRDGWLPR